MGSTAEELGELLQGFSESSHTAVLTYKNMDFPRGVARLHQASYDLSDSLSYSAAMGILGIPYSLERRKQLSKGKAAEVMYLPRHPKLDMYPFILDNLVSIHDVRKNYELYGYQGGSL